MSHAIDLTGDTDSDSESAAKANSAEITRVEHAIASTSSTTKRALQQSGAGAGDSSRRRTNNKKHRRCAKENVESLVEHRCRPPLFRLISTPSDGPGAGTVSLSDIFSGDFTEALLANYMIDLPLLLQAQPRLESVPVVLVHGFDENSQSAHELRESCRIISPSIKLHRPELPQYGTHHGKMVLLKFVTGVRVVILTANFIDQDVNGKSQGVWYQEFPLRPSETCEFEDILVDYFGRIGGPAATFGRTLRAYDFRAARVALVPSVPGTKPKHQQANLEKYGHMRVRALLNREPSMLKDGNHKVICQFSSLASLSAKPNQWLMELLWSFMAEKEGHRDEKRQGGDGKGGSALASMNAAGTLEKHLRIVWPTTEAVRTSEQGWSAGGSIPCRASEMYGGFYGRPDMSNFHGNKPRPELRPILRKWVGRVDLNRSRASPHIKTYCRYREVDGENGQEVQVDGNEVAWFLLTSSNLSRSAWGFLDKNSKQLFVRSFEMGVMFLPSLLGAQGVLRSEESVDASDVNNHDDAFTCTPGEMGLTQRLPLTYALEPDKALPLELLPIPYQIPAPRYEYCKGDRPWVWDQNFPTPDALGMKWTPND